MNEKPMSGSLGYLSENQAYPRMMKPTDVTVAPQAGGFGQNGEQGFSEGANTLLKLTPNQCAPRYSQDGGPGKSGAGTPSVWGKADSFSPSQNHGEEGSTIKVADIGVDLKTGMHMCENPLPK